MPFIPDEEQTSSNFIQDKTWQQKAAAKAPVVFGALGGSAGLPAGLAPTTGAAATSTGEIINQLFNPGPVASKYKAFEKVKPEDLDAFRKEKLGELGKVLGKSAASALIFDIIQGFINKPSVTKKVTKTVTHPQETTMKVREKLATKSKSSYEDKKVLDAVDAWYQKQKMSPTTASKEKKIKELVDATKKIYSEGTTRKVPEILKMRTSSYEKSYTPFGAKQSEEAKLNRVIANTLKQEIAAKDKGVAVADVVYRVLGKFKDAPATIIKKWTGVDVR